MENRIGISAFGFRNCVLSIIRLGVVVCQSKRGGITIPHGKSSFMVREHEELPGCIRSVESFISF